MYYVHLLTQCVELFIAPWTSTTRKILCILQSNSTYPKAGCPDRQFSNSDWYFSYICREFYTNNLPWNYRLSNKYSKIIQNFKYGVAERCWRRYYIYIYIYIYIYTQEVSYVEFPRTIFELGPYTVLIFSSKILAFCASRYLGE